MRFVLLVLVLFVGVCWAGDEIREDGWRDDRENRDRGDRRRDDERRRDEDRYRDEDKRRDEDRQRDDDRYYREDNRDDDCDLGNRNNNREGSSNLSLDNKGTNLDDRDNRDDRCYRDVYFPCDFDDDIDCVRHYFASSGKCTEMHNYGRKPVYRNRLIAYLPGFNLTLILTKTRIKYQRERISRFYINKRTDKLVMAVDFEGINIDSRYTTFVYQRRGQEPIKRTDYTNITVPVTLSAVIPLKEELNFKESRVTAYLPKPLPLNLQIGPRVLKSTNPTVVQVNAAFLADLPKAVLEIFLTEAPSQFFGYLQKYICYFGIPISS